MVNHTPVLYEEVLELLQVEKGALYIDATLGLGGHTLGILKQGGKVLGLDVDQKSIEEAVTRVKQEGLLENFESVCTNFKNIEEIARQKGFSRVKGIIFDLGYSSYELEESGLGLSFLKNEPLDMRLDKSLGVTAADLVNSLTEIELAGLIRDYSDEKLARKFAQAIIKSRGLKKIQTTSQLVEILKSAAPLNYENGRISPATRTFQALRIAVNSEIDNLQKALPRAARLILPGGKMIVISFHSLEDKSVKEFGRNAQPLLRVINKKPITPNPSEVAVNPRSRSAKLRGFIKE